MGRQVYNSAPVEIPLRGLQSRAWPARLQQGNYGAAPARARRAEGGGAGAVGAAGGAEAAGDGAAGATEGPEPEGRTSRARGATAATRRRPALCRTFRRREPRETRPSRETR